MSLYGTLSFVPKGTVLWMGVQWAVTTYGLESLDGEIAIEAATITDYKLKATPETLARWPIEMARTMGVNLDAFITAWLVALAFNSFDGEGKEKLLEGIEIAKEKRKIHR